MALGPTDDWVALAGLFVTVIATTASSTAYILSRINRHKEDTDKQLEGMKNDMHGGRMSALEEYQVLRQEIVVVGAIARKEFGDTIHAIREKVTEVELWTRDQLAQTRHTLYGSMDQRHTILVEMVEKVDDRQRQLELFSAAKHGFLPDK